MAVADPGLSLDPLTLPPRVRRRYLAAASGRVSVMDWIAIAALIGVTILCIAAPVLAPHSPTVPVGQPLLAPSKAFWFGTDEVGRDVFSRVLYGLRSSWFASLVVITSGVLIGGAIGLVAGATGGWIDGALMRFTDVFLALPGPILAIAVVAALGPSLDHTLIAIAIVWWPFYARIVRGEIRTYASRPHVAAARLAGASRIRIMRKHLLPGAVPATLVTASLDVGNLVLTLAALSFLGLGAPDPAPELGAMAARGLPYLLDYWWVPVMPGLGVFFLALVANLAGDGLRDLIGDR
jgi:peptide/nickel transport system permease protein